MSKSRKAQRMQPKAEQQQPSTPKRQEVTLPARILEERRREDNHLISALMKAATDIANVDIDKMERLWLMHKEQVAMRAEQEFSMAKVSLAMELPAIPKSKKIEFIDKNNQKRETPYADRGDIESVLEPLCQRHGFSKEYSTKTIDGKACQALTVRHTSGHKEVYESPYMPLDTSGSKNNNQAAGSTAEYGKRYALVGAFNIIGVDKDDDGNNGKAEGNTGDKFAERVNKEADAVQITGKSASELGVAAAQLRHKVREAPSIERKGEILMRNVKLLGALDDAGFAELSAAIRKLAEEVPTDVKQ